MHSPRPTKLSLCLIFPLLLSACSLFGPKDGPKTQPSPFSNQLNLVETYYNKGRDYLFQNNMDDAKFYFDRAIDSLFQLNTSNPDVQEALNVYVDKIFNLESNFLQDRSPVHLQQDVAFLDEVIATPLFVPSVKESTQIRQKIAQMPESTYSLPVIVNPRVLSFIKAFTTIKRKSIQRALDRSREYIEIFRKTFRDMRLPEDLAYLPLIESGYRATALSKARARGMWQFMSSTARAYGLRVDWVVDERQDPFKSAVAAGKYLKSLYKSFGDWYLALASYNGGPGRISRAVKRLKTKDFSAIARSRYIRRETKNYIPAFLAGLIIAKSPDKYDFQSSKKVTIFENSQTVTVPSPISLHHAAKFLKTTYLRLKTLNPELIRYFTPFNQKTYKLRIPRECDQNTLSQLKRLPPQEKQFHGWYSVKRGDNLYSIARQFNTTVREIKQVNNLKSDLIRPGKRLLIPRSKR